MRRIPFRSLQTILVEATPLSGGTLEDYPVLALDLDGASMPPNRSLELRLRHFSAGRDVLKRDQTRVECVFSIENKGPLAVESLILDLELDDDEGRSLPLRAGILSSAEEDRGKVTVVWAHQATMAPGEPRVVKLVLRVAEVDPQRIQVPRVKLRTIQ